MLYAFPVPCVDFLCCDFMIMISNPTPTLCGWSNREEWYGRGM